MLWTVCHESWSGLRTWCSLWSIVPLCSHLPWHSPRSRTRHQRLDRSCLRVEGGRGHAAVESDALGRHQAGTSKGHADMSAYRHGCGHSALPMAGHRTSELITSSAQCRSRLGTGTGVQHRGARIHAWSVDDEVMRGFPGVRHVEGICARGQTAGHADRVFGFSDGDSGHVLCMYDLHGRRGDYFRRRQIPLNNARRVGPGREYRCEYRRSLYCSPPETTPRRRCPPADRWPAVAGL